MMNPLQPCTVPGYGSQFLDTQPMCLAKGVAKLLAKLRQERSEQFYIATKPGAGWIRMCSGLNRAI
jgi:hypothetical protein